jgi:hypothetical protein
MNRQRSFVLGLFLALGLLLAAEAQAADPCCAIKAINKRTRVVTAQELATGRTFQFKVPSRAVLRGLKVGQKVSADFGTHNSATAARRPTTPGKTGTTPLEVRITADPSVGSTGGPSGGFGTAHCEPGKWACCVPLQGEQGCVWLCFDKKEHCNWSWPKIPPTK